MTTTKRIADDRKLPRPLRRTLRVARSALLGALTGAVPGTILILLAEFVVEGEQQLTVGAPGILLALAGAVVGLLAGTRHALNRRPTETPGDTGHAHHPDVASPRR